MANHDPDDIKRTVDLLFKPGDVVEVRILHIRHRTVSGYFTDRDRLKRTARDLLVSPHESSNQ